MFTSPNYTQTGCCKISNNMDSIDRTVHERVQHLAIEVDEDSTSATIEDQAELELLIEECPKHAFSDGKYFQIDLEKSSFRDTILGICQLCTQNKIIRGTFKSPSNFSTHIKRMHLNEYQTFLDYRKAKNEPVIRERKTDKVICNFSQAQFETNVTNYVLESIAPLRTVEMPTFRKLFDDLHIKKGDLTLKHLSRNSLCRRMESLYKEKMDEIRINLEKEATYVCTTTDIWTSRSRRFIGVSAHWIDSETLLRKSIAIACRRFPDSHTADRITDILLEMHTYFGLDADKIVATVTDNGSNFVKAFREFGVNLSQGLLCESEAESDEDRTPIESLLSTADSNMNCDTEIPADTDHAIYETVDSLSSVLPKHLRCASHTLNLIAAVDVPKIIQSSHYLSSMHFGVFEKCTSIWKTMRSPKSNEVVRECVGSSLPRPVVTRWNSLFDVLNRIVMFKDKIIQVSGQIGITNILKDADFRYLEEYLRILKPLADTIELLQGEHYCYYGYLLPSLISLRRKMDAINQSYHDPSIRFGPLMSGIIQSLDNRFEHFFHLEDEVAASAVAAKSHPRFKTRWLTFYSEFIRQKIEKMLQNAALKEHHKGKDTMLEIDVHGQLDDDFFDFEKETDTEGPPRDESVSVEILRYMASKKTELIMLNEYPIIKQIFIKYNTPLPSSAPVEWLFSYATMMDLPKWNRLTDERFEQRILLKANSIKA